jgi:hypothetical protein
MNNTQLSLVKKYLAYDADGLFLIEKSPATRISIVPKMIT